MLITISVHPIILIKLIFKPSYLILTIFSFNSKNKIPLHTKTNDEIS